MNAVGAIPVVFSADRLASAKTVLDFAHIAAFAEGRLPFVRSFRIDASCAPIDLVPAEARIDRCITTDTSVNVLASLDDAAIVVAAYSRAADVSVAAATHERSETLAAVIRDRRRERGRRDAVDPCLVFGAGPVAGVDGPPAGPACLGGHREELPVVHADCA